MKIPEDQFYPHMPCGICSHKILKLDHGNVDHIIPKSKGGGDEPSNLQFTHKWCNAYKGNKMPGEFKKPSFAWNIKCLALYEMGLLKY